MTQTPDPRQPLPAAHAQPAERVLATLDSSPDGLSSAEAVRRLQTVGPNQLPAPPKPHWLRRFLSHFRDVLIVMLLVAAGLTALLGHWLDTVVILGVVVINAVIGFVQEGKAEQALAAIRQLLSTRAQVRRDGHWQTIEARDLVPGDIIRLRSGDRVPADGRLLEAHNLRLEESALTGESVPAEKQPTPLAEMAGVGDRHNMVHSGTLVAAGRGLAVVTATGCATEMGRINRLLAEVQTLATPLTRQMAAFGRVLAAAISAMAGMMFVAGLVLHDYPLSELVLAAIGFAVAAIPEGLPAILTITLALGVQRMAQRHAITRRLNAVETLGSVTVICSDKTGTLTRNEMTARQVVTPNRHYDVTGTGYAPDGELRRDDQPVTLANEPELAALVTVMGVANEAAIRSVDGHWQVVGDPTEGALRTLACKAGLDTDGYQRLAVIPFESENKFMATLECQPDGQHRILVKGAPDRLLVRCALRPGQQAQWQQRMAELGGQGLRLLAAASRAVPVEHTQLSLDDLQNLDFHGLVAIVDPPRPEAISAIAACHSAGIQVKMITGDHAHTAVAIAREMGIGDGRSVMEGAEIEQMDDEALRGQAQAIDVFARTSPTHKLRLVQALQAQGERVAMTGDGVNDAPALKRADVGVAMGIKGTEVTKEAADIVLADDNFASIERAIEEGRTIYDNLRKAILFILPTNGAQGLVMLAAVLAGLTLPLTPVQILWVNLVVAITLALALAFEPAEPDIMRRPPRDPRAPILGHILLWRIVLVSTLIGGATIALFQWALAQGTGLAEARTLAITTLVMGQLAYLFNSRYLSASSLRRDGWFSNPVLWLATGTLMLLQLLLVYLPALQHTFGTAALDGREWLLATGTGLMVFLLIEGEKAVRRRP